MFYTEQESPVGKLLLLSDGENLTGLYMEQERRIFPQWQRREDLPVFCAARRWLDAYFAGEAPKETVPLKLEGTAFQTRIWEILLTIPYGETRTYGSIAGQLARELGKKKMSAQAVGQAVGRNPVSILVPCHRVVGTGGKLTGYAGGIDRKAWLLRHEGVLK